MSDFTLHTIVRCQVSMQATRQAIAAGAHRAAERFRREQTGQDVLEYTGLLVLVAIVVGGLFGMGVPQAIAGAFGNAVNAVLTNDHTYHAPQAVQVTTTAAP